MMPKTLIAWFFYSTATFFVLAVTFYVLLVDFPSTLLLLFWFFSRRSW